MINTREEYSNAVKLARDMQADLTEMKSDKSVPYGDVVEMAMKIGMLNVEIEEYKKLNFLK